MLERFLPKIFYGKYLYFLAAAMFCCFTASAQQRTVSGVVTDAKDGTTLPGVSVKVKGSAVGTTTNGDGYYKVQVAENSTLVFSYIGFVQQSVAVKANSEINVKLSASDQALEEVVVVAYGTQKKATVTGAISTVSGKVLKQSPAANLAASLAGRLPGLTAIQGSGEPGKDAVALYLRGQGSINGQSPIILVDGVPREMSYIDPNEIESISILKDASSTAMFGVRGANGVILIKTRRGKTDKPEINLSVESGAQAFTRVPQGLNSFDWASLKNQINKNDGLPVTYSDAVLNHYKLQDDPLHFPNNNWQDILMKKYVNQTRYNLNLSGGTEFVNYFINAGYLDQGGQWKVDQKDYDPSSFMKRYNFRSNIDAYLGKKKTLKTFLNLGGYVENVNSPAGNAGLGFGNAINILVDILNLPPITPGPVTEDGKVIAYQNNNAAYGTINRSGFVQETRSNVIASFGMEQDLKALTPGLSIRFMASFDTKAVHRLNETQDYARYNQSIVPSSTGKDSTVYLPANDRVNTTLSPSISNSFQTYANFQGFMEYQRTFKKHAFTGLILAQQDRAIKPQGGDNPSGTDFPLPFNLRGLSARVTYGYNEKYFAEFNAGYNGTEQFAKDRRYGFFPSVSAAWLISNEDFLKGNKILNTFKIRASYGEVGNDRGGISNNRFLYLDNTVVQGGGYVGSGGTLGRGQVINEAFVGNPFLTWETTKKTNIGFDIGLFNSLNLTIDLYQSKNNNMLINRGSVPVLNGLPLGVIAPVNLGKLTNRGYELELNYNKSVNRNLSVLTKLNFNYAKNVIDFIDEPQKTADFAYRYNSTGFSIGQRFGYKSDGFWNSQAEIDNSGYSFSGRAPRPGDLKFTDTNNDKIIDTKDFGPIGYSSVPQYTFGATFGINCKGFDVSALFQGISNVSQDYRGWGVWENWGNGFYTDRHANAWTPERAANGSPILYPALSGSATNSQDPSKMTDYWLEDASYIRLKNAEIGYAFPLKWSQRVGAQKIRFYTNGYNLFTWDKMKNKGYDPEVPGPLTYPVYKTYNFGINVIF